MRSIVFPAFLALFAATAHASEEKRDLGAHVHGVGALNIAIEGAQIALEFEAPGADIVGFEHHAESPEDRQKIDQAMSLLAKPLELFVLPESAECQVSAINVELAMEDQDDHHEDHAKHDEHDHEEHDDHDHAEHDDHGDEESNHTEFFAQSLLSCAHPEAVTHILFNYFAVFSNAQELVVQMISDKGAMSFEVTRDNPRLDLSGMI